MTPKLPVLSGEELIAVLEKFGYLRVRQRGSHVRLRHPASSEHKPVTVPLHDSLARGTLRSILRDAGITVEQVAAYL
jgi:predicted RNA binding protein YcfA (HicA-like mRNA interferase family)